MTERYDQINKTILTEMAEAWEDTVFPALLCLWSSALEEEQ